MYEVLSKVNENADGRTDRQTFRAVTVHSQKSGLV